MIRWLPACLALPLVWSQPVRAEGCDLSRVIGYSLVTQKTIEAYIEKGQRTRGFIGCQPDRVLVFTDNSGVRCRDKSVQSITLPRAFLFARSETDVKVCVGDEMLDVVPAR